MKTNATKYVLILLLTLAYTNVSAQQNYFYKFSQTTGAYADLTGATVLSTDLSQPYHNYGLPAGFKLYDKQAGSILQIGKSGWGITAPVDYFMAYDPFLPAKGLEARASGSAISVKTEMTATDTIVKVEWKNVTIPGHPATDSLNFQMWFYKSSQAIEFRYGPSHLTNMNDSIQITTVLLSDDFVMDYENHQITGSGTNVVDDFDSIDLKLYQGAVPNGTIFKFTRNTAGVTEVQKQLQTKVYPNPAINSISLEAKGLATYSLLDINGKVLSKGIFYNKRSVDISQLPLGMYMVEMEGERHKMVKR